MLRYLFFASVLLLFPLCITAAPAQPDSSTTATEQQIDTQVRIALLEKEVESLKKENQAAYAELQERLEVKKENLDFKMSVAGWFIMIFGVAIPLIVAIVGAIWGRRINKELKEDKNEIKALKAEAKEHLKEQKNRSEEYIARLKEYVREGKACKDELSQLAKQPTNENQEKNVKQAQEIKGNKEATPFEKDWATALELYFSGKHQEALAHFKRLIKEYPDDITMTQLATIYFNMGYSYNELKEHNKALVCFSKAIELGPNYSNAYTNKGNLLDDMGKPEEALVCYNKAIELNPKSSNAYNNKGVLLYKMKKYEEALTFYNKAIELNPKDSTPCGNKGEVLHEIKKYKEALTYYDKALELDPTNEEAKENRERLLKEMGNEENPVPSA